MKKRSRPQVQTDIDVSAMARSSEGFTRVNTTTLIAYLRAQGIPCKVKDKKGDLVAKVMAHLKNN